MIIGMLLAIGLILRLVHFLRVPSVWGDEAALLVNVLNRDFSQMTGSLFHHEAAPPLYMMLERLVMLWLGDHILIMRLPSLLASCGSLILFAFLARKSLSPIGACFAIALFCVSDRLLWHTVEAKPYAIDVFLSLTLVFTYTKVRTFAIWQQSLIWLPILPVIVWLSFPACFIIGGLLLAMLVDWNRTRSASGILCLGLLSAAVAVSFAALVLGPIAAQRDGPMESCWTHLFANWNQPWTVPYWIVKRTLDLVTYCIAPQGWLFGAVVVAGVIGSSRRDPLLVLALTVPIGLVLIAGLIGKYPYGGSRVTVFACPAICLFTGAGIPVAFQWLHRQGSRWPLLLGACLLIPVGHTLHRAIKPWDRADAASAASYIDAHHQPGDCLAFNNWECEYYLRKQVSDWITPADCPPDRPRLWYMVISTHPSERDAMLKAVPPCWKLEERIEFRHVSLGRYGRVADVASDGGSTLPGGLVP